MFKPITKCILIVSATLLVINGVNRPANLMPIDISADGYFLFQEPNEILFVESEITPAYVNDTDGNFCDFLSLNSCTKFFFRRILDICKR